VNVALGSNSTPSNAGASTLQPVSPQRAVRLWLAPAISHNGNVICGHKVFALTESCSKNGDFPRSPLPENGSLMPSAGEQFEISN
jgi:hypothetical protein